MGRAMLKDNSNQIVTPRCYVSSNHYAKFPLRNSRYNPVMAGPKTRESILNYFTAHPAVTTQELASALSLSSADIRYHLSSLLRLRIIEPAPHPSEASSHPSRRGRPSRVLRLAPAQVPNNYQFLAAALLVILQDSAGEFPIPVEAALAKQLAAGHEVVKNMPRRMAGAIAFLNLQQYDASWEARNHGPRIIFHNCPYAAIWQQFPTLCAMDRQLLTHLLGRPVQQFETIQGDRGLHPVCIFQAMNNAPPAILYPTDS
jgi:predicted ArsR family transcriptional regulator